MSSSLDESKNSATFKSENSATNSIKASYINTKDQLADLLTKPLGRIKFLELCSRTSMVQLSHKTTHKT